jgi:hypothetical protein
MRAILEKFGRHTLPTGGERKLSVKANSSGQFEAEHHQRIFSKQSSNTLRPQKRIPEKRSVLRTIGSVSEGGHRY